MKKTNSAIIAKQRLSRITEGSKRRQSQSPRESTPSAPRSAPYIPSAPKPLYTPVPSFMPGLPHDELPALDPESLEFALQEDTAPQSSQQQTQAQLCPGFPSFEEQSDIIFPPIRQEVRNRILAKMQQIYRVSTPTHAQLQQYVQVHVSQASYVQAYSRVG